MTGKSGPNNKAGKTTELSEKPLMHDGLSRGPVFSSDTFGSVILDSCTLSDPVDWLITAILTVCHLACVLCVAIQMGRPTKYTSSVGVDGVRSGAEQTSDNIAVANHSSSLSHIGQVIAAWYQAPSCQSLLQQHWLLKHQSLHVTDAVNPSSSPDSTVKELEHVSNDCDDITEQQRDSATALDLCQKSAASSVPLETDGPQSRTVISRHSDRLSSACDAAATGSMTVSNHQSTTQAELARHCTGTSCVDISATPSTTCQALNLSVKPMQVSHQKSSSDRTDALTSLSHTDSDSYYSGCVLYLIYKP